MWILLEWCVTCLSSGKLQPAEKPIDAAVSRASPCQLFAFQEHDALSLSLEWELVCESVRGRVRLLATEQSLAWWGCSRPTRSGGWPLCWRCCFHVTETIPVPWWRGTRVLTGLALGSLASQLNDTTQGRMWGNEATLTPSSAHTPKCEVVGTRKRGLDVRAPYWKSLSGRVCSHHGAPEALRW